MPWIGGAIAAGGSLLGGAMSAGAAGDAAAAQTAATGRSIAEQQRQFDLTRSDQAPFRNTGVAANQRLAQLLGIGSGASGASQLASQIRAAMPGFDADRPASEDDAAFIKHFAANAPTLLTSNPFGYSQEQLDSIRGLLPQVDSFDPNAANSPDYGSLLRKFSTSDLNADPVYQSGLQFGLDQGTAGINARAIAGGIPGGYDSGATLKALTRFGNDYGSTKANESFNRYNTTNDSIYNKLAGVSGAGQQATNQIQTAGTNASNAISGLYGDQGNASAAGIVGGANAWGNALGGVNSAISGYQNNQILQKLLAGRGGSSSMPTSSSAFANTDVYS